MGRGTPHRGRILPAHRTSRIFHELVFEYRLRLKCPGVMLTWRAFPDCLNISWGGKKLPGYGSAPKWPMPGKANHLPTTRRVGFAFEYRFSESHRAKSAA